MIKSLPTLDVVGAYSGRVLQVGGFHGIHGVFDHLYPGIMTLGVAEMAATASAYLEQAEPRLASLPAYVEGEHEAYAAAALKMFGPTIDVPGPHGSGGPDMKSRETPRSFAKGQR